jgi:hypothetical protein
MRNFDPGDVHAYGGDKLVFQVGTLGERRVRELEELSRAAGHQEKVARNEPFGGDEGGR